MSKSEEFHLGGSSAKYSGGFEDVEFADWTAWDKLENDS